MRYCERWEKVDKDTGELSPISCKSWTCPRCRPAMEKALERKIILARPTHFLTISWQELPPKSTWQHYLRAERKSGQFEAVTIFSPGHLHAITRSTKPPSKNLIKKFFDCQVVVEIFRPSHCSYLISHLGKGTTRQRATTHFYKQDFPDRVSSGKSEPEKSRAAEDGTEKSGAPPTIKPVGQLKKPVGQPQKMAELYLERFKEGESFSGEIGTIIGQLATIIKLLEGMNGGGDFTTGGTPQGSFAPQGSPPCSDEDILISH